LNILKRILLINYSCPKNNLKPHALLILTCDILMEWRRACGRPPTTWIYQICRDMGVTATEALQLVEDRPFWWTIATAGGFG